MSRHQPSLLLIIPAYNEQERIAPVLREYARHFKEHFRGGFRLLVVLNGCTDDTLGVVRSVEADHPEVGHIDFPGRIGKGGALIEGLKRGPDMEWIGYVDADGATSPAAFCALLDHLDEADCVIGSRWLPESVLHVPQTSQRRFYSRAFHALVELLFRMGIKDTQCGAKVMRRVAVEKIHAALTIADMTFDINLLYSLQRAGYRVREVPTEWTDKLGSKVSLSKAAVAWFLSVVRLRLVYSPFYRWLAPVRPLEVWLYRRLGAPPPLSANRAREVARTARRPAGQPPGA
ncbi:MAG: glycosyltransferase [Verrucomicrobiales bacterium]|nr:glycosyltransferase [Verrucomicrobiales bacterium]